MSILNNKIGSFTCAPLHHRCTFMIQNLRTFVVFMVCLLILMTHHPVCQALWSHFAIIGEREQANLVISTADLSLYIFIYFGRWTPPYRNVLCDSKYAHKCEIS